MLKCSVCVYVVQLNCVRGKVQCVCVCVCVVQLNCVRGKVQCVCVCVCVCVCSPVELC